MLCKINDPSGASRPTRRPTQRPVLSTTVVKVTFEVAFTLEGSNAATIAMDSSVELLETVLRASLPKSTRVQLVSVGRISLTRRILRSLQNSAGVEIEFEITMTKKCRSFDCDEVSSAMYEKATSDLKSIVNDGSLSSAIRYVAITTGV